jgi:predicted anti-sigma-YlaC factor YlaD
MQTDHRQSDHIVPRRIIDQSLAGAAVSAQEQQTLREHLAACAACSQYLDESNRAIAALADFSFPLDPALDSKVLAAIAAHAQQLEAESARRSGLWLTSLLALALTAIGSLAVSQLGALATAVFHIQPAQLRFGLATFWITPSVLVCMLLLPGFQTVLGRRKGLSL